MLDPLNIGLIGCGAIGRNHAENFVALEESRLVAVADVLEERAKEFGQRSGADVYIDYRKMLKRPDLDAVSICLPHHLHAEAAVTAAEAGKHVLCEKPMALNLKQADEMIKAAAKAGVKLSIVMAYRFSELNRRLCSVIREGKLGNLILGDLIVKWYRSQSYYDSAPWRGKWGTEGGGILINQMIHSIDLFQWFMGDIESLRGWIATKTHKIEVEDIAVAKVNFRNGAIGIIEGTTSAYPGFPKTIFIHGTNGSIVMSGHKVNVVTPEEEIEYFEEELPSLQRPPFVNPKMHMPIIKDFLLSIIQDREPVVNGEEGRKSLEIVRAIYKSSKSGENVRFPVEE